MVALSKEEDYFGFLQSVQQNANKSQTIGKKPMYIDFMRKEIE